jgi:aspartate dehydrogenase
MSDVRVGIVGAGTIGTAVGRLLAGGAVPNVQLVGYLVRSTPRELDAPLFETLETLLAAEPAVVVEAASHDAVHDLGEPILAAGCHLVCASVGALSDGALRHRLAASAAEGRSRLLVPSGAIGGLDILRAAAEGGLDEVVIEQRKPASVLLPSEEANALRTARVLFEGTVADVVALYPKTTNVAAAVALAGLGFDSTIARVVADPTIRANIAILRAKGAFGELTLELRNVATANPRTSAVTALSIVATVRRLVEPLVV